MSFQTANASALDEIDNRTSKAKPPRPCADCGVPIKRPSKRCKPCAGKALEDRK